MFKMASAALAGRRALIVESEGEAALRMAEDLRLAGGREVGTLPSVEAALRFVQGNPAADCVILDVQQAECLGQPLTGIFAAYGVAVVFITGFDDWYLDDDEDELHDSPTSYARG